MVVRVLRGQEWVVFSGVEDFFNIQGWVGFIHRKEFLGFRMGGV